MEEVTDDILDPGTKLGPYVIWQQIGAGGMGEVYEAYEEQLNRRVALKVISTKVVGDLDSVERFRLEGQALARLSHPNIIGIYSLGFDAGRHYLAMEFVEGQSLHDFHHYGVYGIGELLKIFAQLLAGTSAAHAGCVIHRDLKPKNVLVSNELTVKIVDFGIAKLFDEASADITQQGQFLGTVRYIAPEIVRGGKPTAQSDIFALGVMIYELLTDMNPFQGANDLETLDNIKTKVVDFPPALKTLLPQSMQTLVLKMIAKEPAKRYGTLATVMEDFQNISTKDFPEELLKPTPHRSLIENPGEVASAVKLLNFSPLEKRIITAIAARLEQERSSGGFTIEGRDGGGSLSDETSSTLSVGASNSQKFRISQETLQLAIAKFEEIREDSENSNTRKFRLLDLDEDCGPKVEVSEFETAMKQPRVPPPVRRASAAAAWPAAVPSRKNGGTGLVAATGADLGSAIEVEAAVERDPESTQATWLRRQRGRTKEAGIARTVRRYEGTSTFTYVLLFALALTIALFGTDHLGYMDSLLEVAGFAPATANLKPQSEFKIRKHMTPAEMAASGSQKLDRTAGLPSFKFGDEYRFRHTAVNGKGFRIVTEAELVYSVVGMVGGGDRVSWNVGEQGTRTTARNPFFGDLEDHTIPDAVGRHPSSLVYVGDVESFFPLRVGAKMQLTRASNAGESYQCEVAGEEKVVVPAGEFMASRVDCKTAGGARYREETFYYSAQVGYWVQRKTFMRNGEHQRTDVYALTFYKRAPAAAK